MSDSEALLCIAMVLAVLAFGSSCSGLRDWPDDAGVSADAASDGARDASPEPDGDPVLRLDGRVSDAPVPSGNDGPVQDISMEVSAGLDSHPARDGPIVADVSCPAGQHFCRVGGVEGCVNDNEVEWCGSRCSPCPSYERATATCMNASQCGFTCNSGASACTNNLSEKVACGATAWDFEDGVASPWDQLDSGTDSTAVMKPMVSQDRATSGSRALKTVIAVAPMKSRIMVGGRICPLGTRMSRQGTTASAQVYITGGPTDGTHGCALGVWGQREGEMPQYLGSGNYDMLVMPGRWTRLQFTLNGMPADHVTTMHVICSLDGDNWSGAFYVDDIRLE